ncbi:hypothetical protein FOCC_FOCC001004 [Frankliniella occidentalis]|uniref:Zinc finger protein 512B-like n=1 Tax=Frankliniella occidentalis TaxID=133901 RepID=A0A6J1TLM4_FRAOC|nr:zinc finger protein 512B-like [Frankliniella occidentalis]KAE8752211.1 hypothetical protein FOCC_FOCC001004 [Frankliniella occidentalis]
MKFLAITIMCLALAAAESGKKATEGKKSEKRGIHDLGYGYGGSELSLGLGHTYSSGYGDYLSGHEYGHHEPITKVITKHVPYSIPQPVPVEITKHVPYIVKVPVHVPVDRPYEVAVPKPYTVHVDRPYPVTVEKPYPVHIKVPVKVAVPHPVPYDVPKPYPVHVEVPKPYKVPVEVPVYVKEHHHEHYPSLDLGYHGSSHYSSGHYDHY